MRQVPSPASEESHAAAKVSQVVGRQKRDWHESDGTEQSAVVAHRWLQTPELQTKGHAQSSSR
jgi:hypothetical protein